MALRVLVADDDSLMRTLMSVSLSASAEIVEAADGDEALATIQQHEFDVLLLDWDMPGKTGIELTRYVRARDSRVPIVMVTGKAERDEVVQAVEAGVSDYLLKPFQTAALQKKLENLCPGFHAEPEPREPEETPS